MSDSGTHGDWEGEDHYVANMLLTAVLAPIFPLGVVTAAYAAYIAWRRRDYVFIVGAAACVTVSALRNVFVGAVACVAVAALYHVLRRRAPKHYEWLLWVMAGLSLTATYFMTGAWGLPEYVNVFREWWSGKMMSSLVPAHFALTFTAVSVAYSSQVSAGKGFWGRVAKYFSENPGALPVAAFIVSLLAAAAWLAMGLEGNANKAAELAYYFLVAGVALQLYEVLREGR